MPVGKIIEQTFPDGITRKIMEVDFVTEKEDWNVYKLSDGTSVKIRVIPAKMFRVVDDLGNPAYNPEGDPFVIVRNTIQVISSE